MMKSLGFVAFFSDVQHMSGVRVKVDRQCKALGTHFNVGRYFFAPIQEEGLIKIRWSQLGKYRETLRVCRNSDIVYMRYPNASLWLLLVVMRYGRKVVFEHNTIELRELWQTAQSWRGWYRFVRECVLGPFVLSMHAMSLGVSKDFVAHQQNRSFRLQSSGEIFNAIEVREVELDNCKQRDKRAVSFVSLVMCSSGMD